MRIAKAVKEGRWGKVKVLMYLLTRSLAAKLLAVRRVTSNKGKRTPGIDGILWKDATDKINAVLHLTTTRVSPPTTPEDIHTQEEREEAPLEHPHHARPGHAGTLCAGTGAHRRDTGRPELLRVPGRTQLRGRHRGGLQRTVKAELGDMGAGGETSKGATTTSASNGWWSTIPMDREILRKWLEAGYVEDGHLYPTHKGTPQGGIISPILANMTLDGMEQASAPVSTPPFQGQLHPLRG